MNYFRDESLQLIRYLRRTGGRIVHYELQSSRQNTAKLRGDSRFDCEGIKRQRGAKIPQYPYAQSPPAPLTPRPRSTVSNPVLTGAHVTDFTSVDFVADPFLFVSESEGWHLFFEVFSQHSEPTAAIGHATSPDNGRTWEYDRIVLEADIHLAFPYVFKWDGAYYMIPSGWAKSEIPARVNLYRTSSLPDDWRNVAELIAPETSLFDCVLFRREGRWWALAGTGTDLYIYYSKRLEANQWIPHTRNPVVVGRPHAGRPAGRPIVRKSDVLVFLQDCTGPYGKQVWGYRITELTPSTYTDRPAAETPILEPSSTMVGWNAARMHHIDPWYINGEWYCAVDGNIGLGSVFGEQWSIGIYEQHCLR